MINCKLEVLALIFGYGCFRKSKIVSDGYGARFEIRSDFFPFGISLCTFDKDIHHHPKYKSGMNIILASATAYVAYFSAYFITSFCTYFCKYEFPEIVNKIAEAI